MAQRRDVRRDDRSAAADNDERYRRRRVSPAALTSGRRSSRLVAEIEGFAFHSSADRFESDRRRDAVLAATGLRVIRVTWPQMLSEPEAMLVRLGQALVRTSPL
jgi:hypothetical protein